MTITAPVSFPALGTTATVITTSPRRLGEVEAVLRGEVDRIDRACSRFRADSELTAVNQAPGEAVRVSPLFLSAVQAALRAARLTSGLVDPTVGQSLQLLGYDRDFPLVPADGPPIRFRVHAAAGWQTVEVDAQASTIRVPKGVQIDLGATAKALCADRAASRAAAGTGCGVLISLGGDVAVAGPAPGDGWPVQIAEHHAAPLDRGAPVVTIASGGLATSSTTVRRWARRGEAMHHLIDPSTGGPAAEVWRTVTVAAASCLDANIATCASVIMGQAAPRWLAERGLPGRLVGADGNVVTVGDWPAEGGPRC
jgi:thiamine biosynthesis lipoprotein